MTLFCPDGYVPVQEAIAKAALHWFSEQIATLETATAGGSAIKSDPNTDVNAMTRLDALTRALGKPSISQGLLQQFEHILTQTEHRLRNFLHQGVLTAYYFGGLFHPGRNAVEHGFWATPEADRVLMSGTYWPFGKAPARHEQRPDYPLFFLELELAASLSDEPKPPLPNPDVTNISEYKSRDDAITTRVYNTEAENAANGCRDEGTSRPNRRKSRPAFERARRKIEELYPDRVPDQATESNASLCRRVSAKLKEEKLPDVSDDTILRAAGRRK